MVQAHLQPTSAQSNAGRRAMLAAGISMLVSAPYQLAKGEPCHALCYVLPLPRACLGMPWCSRWPPGPCGCT